MTTFHVADMSCGHCVKAITQAIRAVDDTAAVHIDLASHHVVIDGAGASPAALARVIAEAGYTPVELQDQAPVTAASKACCGGCGCR
jgi:copper chaperone